MQNLRILRVNPYKRYAHKAQPYISILLMQPQYSENHEVLSASQYTYFHNSRYCPIGQSATPQTKPNNSGYSIYAQQTIFHWSAKIPPRICLADSNDTTTSTHTVKTWQCSILHRPSMCWRCSFWHTFHSLVQETGNRKPWIFFTQNNLIHLSPTLNILSQKAQPFGRSNHCGPPKWSLVHHHMSAHICRLHNSWWQDLINSSSLRILPRDLFCAFERFSWHSWQTACWHSPLFARQHMNTQ